MVVHAGAGCPLEGEAAHHLAQEIVVFPCRLGHIGVGEAALVGEELDDGDVILAVLLEAGQALGDLVGEREGAALHEEPHRAGREDLGIGVEQPQGVVLGRGARRIGARLADGGEHRELAVTRHRVLGPWIAPLGHVPRDGLVEALQRLGIEVERRGRGLLEGGGHGRAPLRAWGDGVA